MREGLLISIGPQATRRSPDGVIQKALVGAFDHVMGQRSQLCSLIGRTDVMVHRGRRRHRAGRMECARELATAADGLGVTRLAEHY